MVVPRVPHDARPLGRGLELGDPLDLPVKLHDLQQCAAQVRCGIRVDDRVVRHADRGEVPCAAAAAEHEVARGVGNAAERALDEVVIVVGGLAEGTDHAVRVGDECGVLGWEQGAHLAADGYDEIREGGYERGGVPVCGEDDSRSGDGAAGGVESVILARGGELCDGSCGLEVQTPGFDEVF